MPTHDSNPNATTQSNPSTGSLPDPIANPYAQPAPDPAAGATADVLSPTSVYARAFEQHLAAMRAIDASALLVLNVDIPSATTMVSARLNAIRALRGDIARELPAYDLARFDSLESVTQALSCAQARYLVAAAPVPILPALSQASVSLRDQLAAELAVLGRRGLVDPGRLGELKGPAGYKNVAYDLLALATLVRESWPKIKRKSAIEPADVDRAEQLAHELLVALAQREEKPEKVAEASLERQRAFTLFANTYDHVRRAVAFLRWDEGDADAIAPSLYAGRSNGRRKEPDEPVTAPLPTLGGSIPSAASMPAAAVGAAPASPFPDGDPFTS